MKHIKKWNKKASTDAVTYEIFLLIIPLTNKDKSFTNVLEYILNYFLSILACFAILARQQQNTSVWILDCRHNRICVPISAVYCITNKCSHNHNIIKQFIVKCILTSIIPRRKLKSGSSLVRVIPKPATFTLFCSPIKIFLAPRFL